MLPYDVTKPQWVITLSPEQKDWYLADHNPLSNAFFNHRSFVRFDSNFTEISSKDPFNKEPVLVQIMAWHQKGEKPWSEPVMT